MEPLNSKKSSRSMQSGLEKNLIPPYGNQKENNILRALLISQTEKAIASFPKLFDVRLYQGLERLIVNTSSDFLPNRSFVHLRTILLVQFFLQKKIEKTEEKALFLKLFKMPSKICMALTLHASYGIQKEQLLKTLLSLIPGIQEVPRSCYLWYHPELPYIFCYLEVRKLRGEELSLGELRETEETLHAQFVSTPLSTPAIFWPYNEEESYRQIQLLQREVKSRDDLPHISIHFREQTASFLEFLIHFVCPKAADQIGKSLNQLPGSLDLFWHFYRELNTPFPIELGAFSLKIPSSVFNARESINLLYARRYIIKHLEAVLGRLRDYNGGLFENQQYKFEAISIQLKDKIPHFDLFAEKLFYAFYPLESRLGLSTHDTEDLFRAFSEAINKKESFAIVHHPDNVLVIKTNNSADLFCFNRIIGELKDKPSHAKVTLGGLHYLCLLSSKEIQIEPFLQELSFPSEKTKTLRLIFQEGAPLSLNPHHSSGDMRSRMLSKLLFEGLVRLNADGNPELAGASHINAPAGGNLYTFKLRSMHWSNGENVTAVDYVAGLQYALNAHVSHPEIIYIIKNARKFKAGKCDAHELGIYALDSETLQIELEWPDPHFLSKLAQPFFFPLFGSMREPKWFNGPYLVREQNKDKILLERNPYFWDSDKIFFEQIEIGWESDVDEIYKKFQNEETDWVGDCATILSLKQVNQLQEAEKLHRKRVSRRFLVCFNTKNPILASSSIRRALSLSIDRSLISSTLFPHSAPVFPLSPDKDAANMHFENGLQELGITRKDFPPITFSYSHHPRREKLAFYLQQTWGKILGITIHLEKVEWNIFRSMLEKHSFEITGTIQDTVDQDSPEFLERFEGSSSWNFSGWVDPLYRELVIKAKDQRDESQRKELIKIAERILETEVPFTPLFNYTHLYAHRPDLEGYLIDPEGCIDFSRSFLKN